MKVVVFGANGFIGSAVVQRLARSNTRVLAVVHDSTWRLDQMLTEEDWEYVTQLRVDLLFTQSMENYESIRSWHPQVVINCAWAGMEERFANNYQTIAQNLTLHHNVIAMTLGNNAQYLFLGSHLELEKEHGVPTTLYGIAKDACRQLVIKELKRGQVSWVRLWPVCGPRDRLDTGMAYFLSTLTRYMAPQMTDCQQLWNYMYVHNVADQLVNWVEDTDDDANQLYNMCPPEHMKLRWWYEHVQKLARAKLGPKFKSADFCVKSRRPGLQDVALPYLDVGPWHVASPSDEQINETIDWYIQHGSDL